MTVTKLARSLAACAAVVVLAAGVTACGGSGGGDDKTKVENRVNGLYDAFASKDEKKICGSLSDTQKEQITKSSAKGGKKQSCEQVMSFALAFLGDQLKTAKDAKVTDVKVDGDKATATVEFKGKKGKLGLAKQGGDWLVNDFNLQKL
jgi:uncharacterized protein (DUF2147 family)